MTTFKFAVVVIGAFLICGPCIPGTWFGRPSYYRPSSAFAGWGK